MAKIYNTFRFNGIFKTMEDGVREITSQNNSEWKGKEINFQVKTETGSQIVRLFGGLMQNKPITTFSKDKDDKGKLIKLEIPMSKRFEKEVVDQVADFKKIKIGKEVFITEWDAIEYIENNSLELEGQPIAVTGQVQFDAYKGKVYNKYYMNNIFTEIKDSWKEGFNGQLALFVDSNTIPEDYRKGKGINYSLIEKERKIVLDTYIEEYNRDKSTKDEVPYLYIPIQTCISVSDKFDFKNPDHMKKLKFRIESLAVKKGVHEIGMTCKFFKGAEKEDIKEEDLSTWEKARIENGDATLEEIVKGKQGYGEFKEEIQLMSFHSKYEEGLEETDLTEDDLLDLYVEEDETSNKEEVATEEVIDDDADLF